MQAKLDDGVQPFKWYQDIKRWTTLSQELDENGKPHLRADPIDATKMMYKFIQSKREIKSLTIVDQNRRPIAFENLDDLL